MSDKPWIVPLLVVVALAGVIALMRASRPPLQPLEEEVQARSTTPRQARVAASRRRPGSQAADDKAWGGDDWAQHAARPPARHPTRDLAATPGHGNSPELAATEQAPDLQPPEGGALVVKAALSVGFDGSPTASNGTEPLQADAVEFDDLLGAARFPPNAVLNYPDSGGVDTTAGTILFWVHMEWDPTQEDRRSKTLAELRAGGWENRIEMNLGPPTLSCLFTNSEGLEQSVGTNIRWQLGEWHHVAVTWGDSVATLFVDGTPRQERELVGTIEIPPGRPLYVGSTYNGPLRARQGSVSLRAWSVFQQPLLQEDISAIMIQTAPAS